MKALDFFRAVTHDERDLAGRCFALLDAEGVRYCVVGGQAVNAYAEPLVSLDLDLAVSSNDIERIPALLGKTFAVERFPGSVNIADPGSALRVRFLTDPRYFDFVERASTRTVLGIDLPVACLEDVFRGKIWAALDATRRPSKRQKDLADIARLLEGHPRLRTLTPPEILDKLEKA